MDLVRLSFFVAGEATKDDSGWHLPGEPGFDLEYWARPGEQFEFLLHDEGATSEEVELTVVTMAHDFAVLSGDLPKSVARGDILIGETLREVGSTAGPAPVKKSTRPASTPR